MSIVFVTVGSTSFDKLVDKVIEDNTLSVLRQLGYTKVIVQYGRGNPREPLITGHGVSVALYAFKPSLHDDMAAADLIISHAGSGSIMESLRLHKKLVVVVNEDLMDNHQIELAQALSERQYLCYGMTRTLVNTLVQLPQTRLVPFPDPKPDVFASELNSWFGGGA